ncbi:endonuclease I family protein [Bdellovibrio svalbardensis]|uniref:Endonuclease n=1 Tax=Bdellovibrio svalbardensis TaxID=2972972 RepID=A0ABT6DG44_9BACT|nr:endonuclease [Bdellovibrio svalbardensis]MDG0815815.1 endonuclease [Bdellovibrio svalbardensis]
MVRSFVILSVALLLTSIAARADLRSDLKKQVISSHHPISYDQAQVALLGNVALIRLSDGSYAVDEVYCSTPYGSTHLGNSVGPGKEPSSMIINVEHTVAQSWFKGRAYFNVGRADLHHLYPSDSKANSMRGNFQFGEVTEIKNTPKCFDEQRQTISTESKLGSGNGGNLVFEPPTKHKGNVARAVFYFAIRYDFPVPSALEATLRRWNKLDPVDQTELDRNDAIEKIQGNRNPFIDHPEYVDQISKF